MPNIIPSQATTAISNSTDMSSSKLSLSKLANRYRGATVEDLDPPSALSCNPTNPVSYALISAFERDYTHLTVYCCYSRYPRPFGLSLYPSSAHLARDRQSERIR
ncbi:hypothetical protein DID88_007629 [Monilinia fructigena]|uniref:Uncharacterized protein n=1 Tax=Monilinia fructigena TaxID=38457 RepID=A0A395J3L8_9HELO|nr:hypothetical protein DID88_007629 [Monilinia fructigena]